MAEPSNQKKIIKRVLVIVSFTVVLFFYFFGLGRAGEWYRRTYPAPPSPPGSTTLKIGWVFHPGDDRSWSDPMLDDHEWKKVRPDSLPDDYHGELGWFRLRFAADTFMQRHPTVLLLHMSGAAEVYLDGKQIALYGH